MLLGIQARAVFSISDSVKRVDLSAALSDRAEGGSEIFYEHTAAITPIDTPKVRTTTKAFAHSGKPWNV